MFILLFPFIITQIEIIIIKVRFSLRLLFYYEEEIFFSFILIFLLFYSVLSLSNDWSGILMVAEYHYDIIMAFPFPTNITLHFTTMKTNIALLQKNGRTKELLWLW